MSRFRLLRAVGLPPQQRHSSPIHRACLRLLLTALVALMLATPTLAAGKPKPPAQPADGPGGSNYKHAVVKKAVFGEGDLQYWLYEPAEPTPESGPLVVFNHGWGGINPLIYGAWIEHIVRRGNVVVFPRYQANLATSPRKFAQNASQAVKDAVGKLKEEGHVKPDLEKFAIVGHSAGGQTTANMAALAASLGLPEPKAIMCVQPGKSWGPSNRLGVPLEDLEKIPAGVLLLTVVGDRDTIVGDGDAKKIFKGAKQVPPENKAFVVLVSDDHGEPALEATHFAPCAANKAYDSGDVLLGSGRFDDAPRDTKDDSKDMELAARTVDALDHYALWKLFDGLCDAAFKGENRKYALGDTEEQRFMGKWSDDTPVKELVIKKEP
ncbi:MAG: alpha/beta hydrolase fold domain-containing protein [Planctomycetota bacterium]|nr:alpha/beta hydrolase fold domain-containing protein [Planctomycetota bacterium]